MTSTVRPLRADAAHNRERILAAARDAFVEHGPSAPLDDIARRAGTGIATLYRRFPDRDALMRAVVIDALHRTAVEAERAAQEESDPFDGLVRYMRRALEIRVAAVIPALLDEISLHDEEMDLARLEGLEPVQRMITAAHRAGTLRKEVTSGDIGLLIVRLSRPMPGPFSREANDSLSRRHLDFVVHGMRAKPARKPTFHGPSLSLGDLRKMTPRKKR